ncbi:MAG: FkbM family methyltransferase [Thermoproteota archaeon]
MIEKYFLKKFIKLFAGKIGRRLGSILWSFCEPILYHILPDIVYVHGSKMLKNRSILFPLLLMASQKYESDTVELFKQVIKEGMVVVDVGASFGFYTLLASKLVGKSGRVYAFEPDPRNFYLLTENVRLNQYTNVTCVKKAILDKPRFIKLFLSTKGPLTSTVFPGYKVHNAINIEATSLDIFFKDINYVPIHVIKMDIEGAEMLAILGAEEVLKRNRDLKIFIEFYPEGIRRSGFTPETFFNKLLAHGFKIYVINGLKKQIDQLELTKMLNIRKKEWCINLFLERPSSMKQD